MALLDADNRGKAVHVCDNCGNQTEVKKSEWIVDEDTFTTPPCPCRAQTTYQWHDAVMESTFEKRVPVLDEDGNPRKVFDGLRMVEVTQTERWTEPDPDHPGARMQVLAERIARALGCKQQKRGSGKLKYPRVPKAAERKND
jgi:hypothetical protein